jgi:hypothetical protein
LLSALLLCSIFIFLLDDFVLMPPVLLFLQGA